MVQDYPATHFEALIAHSQRPLPSITVNVLSLLARLATHSSSSGHTPPTLSPLFGPPPYRPWSRCAYLFTTPTFNTFAPLMQWSTSYSPLFVGKTHQVMSRLVRLAVDLAVQHLLAYARGSRIGFGVTSHALGTSHSINEARQVSTSSCSPHGVRCQRKAERPHVYARSCEDCCKLGYSTSHQGDSPQMYSHNRDWERVTPPTLKLMSRYADTFEKRMDFPPNLYPHTGVASSNASIASSTTVSTLGDSTTNYFGLGKPAVAGEERFRSLTEPKWGEFEAKGFGSWDPGEKKL